MTEQPSPGLPSPAFWRGRRVLLTGHTGFKGSWLSVWLCELGAEVLGVSLPTLPTNPALWDQLNLVLAGDIRADLCDADWQPVVADFDPQTVLHLAAQPLVTYGYAHPLRTFSSNVMGTAQVLDLLPRLPSLEAALIVTTDKVYDSRQGSPHAESDFFGGRDPYSASKACTELMVHSWPSHGPPTATARAGNVIGGGDWGDDRLMPDLVRSWSVDGTPQLRRPSAVRPWQHVLEPLCGYLMYAEALCARKDVPSALNFGPDEAHTVPVLRFVEHAASEWARINQLAQLPEWTVMPEPPILETQILEIDSRRARSTLGWRNQMSWQQAVTMSVDWYVRYARGEDAQELIREQLACLNPPASARTL
jgi:CDP-glucose 4,6-dehydratase